MDTTSPLFPLPVEVPYVELRTACAEWIRMLIALRRVSRRTRRAFLARHSASYAQIHRRLWERCEACQEIATEAQRLFLEHVRCVIEPWTELSAVAYLPLSILEDLILKAQEIERRLYGNYQQMMRRRRLMMAAIIMLVSSLLAPPLAQFAVRHSGNVSDSVRDYESQVFNYAQRVTDRQRLILVTFIVLGGGIAGLYSSRQY